MRLDTRFCRQSDGVGGEGRESSTSDEVDFCFKPKRLGVLVVWPWLRQESQPQRYIENRFKTTALRPIPNWNEWIFQANEKYVFTYYLKMQ